MTSIGRFSPNKVRKRVIEGTWAQEDDYAVGQGMALLTPTSITYTGTSATTKAKIIDGSGSVEVTDCATVSLNGVFTSTYDNYLISLRPPSYSTNTDGIVYRLRASGSDNATTSYAFQYLQANGINVSAARNSSMTYGACMNVDQLWDGSITYIYGPALAQPTASRSVAVNATGSIRFVDYASTHSVSTSYDGITFLLTVSTGVFSSLISIYGLVGA